MGDKGERVGSNNNLKHIITSRLFSIFKKEEKNNVNCSGNNKGRIKRTLKN